MKLLNAEFRYDKVWKVTAKVDDVEYYLDAVDFGYLQFFEHDVIERICRTAPIKMEISPRKLLVRFLLRDLGVEVALAIPKKYEVYSFRCLRNRLNGTDYSRNQSSNVSSSI